MAEGGMEWQDRGMVAEQRNGEWRNGGMAELWIGGSWRNGRMAEWRDRGTAKGWNDGTAEWRNGRMAERPATYDGGIVNSGWATY